MESVREILLGLEYVVSRTGTNRLCNTQTMVAELQIIHIGGYGIYRVGLEGTISKCSMKSVVSRKIMYVDVLCTGKT